MGAGASVSNRVLRVHLIKRFVPGLEGGGCICGQTWGEGVPSRARVVQRGRAKSRVGGRGMFEEL